MGEKYKCPYCGVTFYESPENTKERRISFFHDQEDFEGIRTYSCIKSQLITIAQRVMNILFSWQARMIFLCLTIRHTQGWRCRTTFRKP